MYHSICHSRFSKYSYLKCALLSHYSKDPKYSAKPPQGILVNWIGLLTGLFSALVIYLASTPGYKPMDKKDEDGGQSNPGAELSTVESDNQYQKPQL